MSRGQLFIFSVIMNEIQLAIDNLIKLEKASFEIDFSAINQINSIKSYIYSIFYNLISNSIKYRRPDVQPVIKIKSSIVDNQILLVFSDNGLGIDLKKIRIPFSVYIKGFIAILKGRAWVCLW